MNLLPGAYPTDGLGHVGDDVLVESALLDAATQLLLLLLQNTLELIYSLISPVELLG